MGMKLINFSQLTFKDWNHISEGKKEQFGPPVKQISSFFSRTYFYYDTKTAQLYYKNFNIIERLLHLLFGYASEFRRENLWEFFKARKWVPQNETCPSKQAFRRIVGEKLSQFSKTRDKLFWGAFEVAEDDFIKLFEKGLDVNVYDYERNKGYKAIHVALEHKFSRLARYLIEHGADINAEAHGNVCWTPLARAVASQNWEMADLLLSKNANVNSPNHQKLTILHFAVGGGQCGQVNASFKPNHALIHELLNRGAAIDAVSSGCTPLFYAVKREDEELVRLLLDRGADPTPVLGTAVGLYNPRLVKMLLDKGAKIGHALHQACGAYNHERGWQPNLEIVQLLLDKSDRLDELNQEGRTPLRCALEGGHRAAVERIVAYIAAKECPNDPNLQDLKRRNALVLLYPPAG